MFCPGACITPIGQVCPLSLWVLSQNESEKETSVLKPKKREREIKRENVSRTTNYIMRTII